MALNQEDQEFDVGVQNPFSQLAAPTLIEQHQPVRQTLVIQSVLAPTVQVQHVTHLFRRCHCQQPDRIVEPNLLEGVQYGLGGERPDYGHTVLCREEELLPLCGIKLHQLSGLLGD